MIAQLKGLGVLVISYPSSRKIPCRKTIQDQQTAGLNNVLKTISPSSPDVVNEFHSGFEVRYTFATYLSDLVQALADSIIVNLTFTQLL